MITVACSTRQGEHALTVTGHACYNPGNDIVCAGVSAITFALLGWLLNSGADYSAHYESGECAIRCRRTRDTDTAFDLAVIGFAQIAECYPDNVTIEIADADG